MVNQKSQHKKDHLLRSGLIKMYFEKNYLILKNDIQLYSIV